MTAEQRRAFLDQACGGAAEIRAGVESLLAALQRAGDFLADPTIPAESLTPIFPAIGSRIGSYTLRKLIGEGGTGLVFLAEQDQPLKRHVALKVIKAGMDSREVIARFEAERQALALMDHPNIAKVFDAGTSEDGRPYFVMELVGGRPITEFCRRHRLPIRSRVKLIMDVCKAVQHAHQKGILHRDLKPTNVLVAVHDRRPVPKVIDFGIAKALHGPLVGDASITMSWQLIGTPQYMSPEQVNMSPDLDARSDIYSLGAMLYELLSGRPPFEPSELASKPLNEWQRMLREVQIVPPSRRAEMEAEKVGEISLDQRHEQLRQSRQVKGDLDAIALKALRSNREERYPTAAALAEDLDRFLDDVPVQARPPSTFRDIGRAARRYSAALIAPSLIIIGATVAVVLWAVRPRPAVEQAKPAVAVSIGNRLPAQSQPIPQRAPPRVVITPPIATRPAVPIVSTTSVEKDPRLALLRTSRLALSFDRASSRRDGDTMILTDLSDQHNDAIVNGGYFVPGVSGEGLHLGPDERINTTKNIGIRQNGPRTISVYLSFPKVPQGRSHSILGWGAGTQGRNFWLKVSRARFMLWSSGHGMDWELPLPVDSNVWHHHVITYNGETAHWRMDGTEIGNGFRHDFTTIDTPLEIGGTEFSIDELAVFDRVLTTKEIDRLAAAPGITGTLPDRPLAP